MGWEGQRSGANTGVPFTQTRDRETIAQKKGNGRVVEKMSKKALILIALLITAASLPPFIQWAREQWNLFKQGKRAIVLLEAFLNESKTQPYSG